MVLVGKEYDIINSIITNNKCAIKIGKKQKDKELNWIELNYETHKFHYIETFMTTSYKRKTHLRFFFTFNECCISLQYLTNGWTQRADFSHHYKHVQQQMFTTDSIYLPPSAKSCEVLNYMCHMAILTSKNSPIMVALNLCWNSSATDKLTNLW